ncbi:NAD(P)H-hydrate dehydratase [Gracilibacillus caseinilyticus]|uniref:Bifunctional NAD(P)H-hydrate repair enzyme n=1 Tax=Gracilibacillus caseinilyticus TaxID=2932256 RepID=A0ABY4EYU5_9BACI|nr:NAD(P)H-hydrate dehydratase [Gracilibacillus caseinilyticus]UOQ49130.1 NAD(P)H-hydrate dehydratase [Gracilibacillus caseinilyticus]
MYIVTAEEMYEIDRYAIEKGGIEGKILMENAGSQVAQQISQTFTEREKTAVLVGSGNNGGDGFVIARYLVEVGFDVTVFQLVADEKIKGDAAFHKQLWLNTSHQLYRVTDPFELEQYLRAADIVIDAILGIGVSGEIREPIRSFIDVINQSGLVSVAIDIPSGLPANEGIHVDKAIIADLTYIIDAPKMTVFLEDMSRYYGKWQVVNIGIPDAAHQSCNPNRLWCKKDVLASFPKRDLYAHKGSNGKGMVIGGQAMMPGSILLSARAALRSGAGLLTVATVRENVPIVASQCVEATYHLLEGFSGGFQSRDMEAFQQMDAIAFGMGIGRDKATMLLELLESTTCPVLIDADGLYQWKDLLGSQVKRDAPTVITPHFGEMAMLTDRSVAELKQHPFSISRQFAQQHQVYVVLKGKNTVITAPDGDQIVSDQGNAGLAKGGTGDVLSGILLTMLMQHQDVLIALANGCYLHGTSAEYLVEEKHSEIDLLATDVIEGLSQVFRTLS